MSDVYQTGAFATLHRLKSDNLLQMERDLKRFSSARPIALVLPALYSEFAGDSMLRIREELTKVHYLNEIVVSLGQAGEEQFHAAQLFFRRHAPKGPNSGNDGPRSGASTTISKRTASRRAPTARVAPVGWPTAI